MNQQEHNRQKLPPIKKRDRSKDQNRKKEQSSEHLEQKNFHTPTNHNQSWFEAKNAKRQEKYWDLQNLQAKGNKSPKPPIQGQKTNENPYITKQPENNGLQNDRNPTYPDNQNPFQPPQPTLQTQNDNINRFQPQVQNKQFPRQSRIGCCCVSVNKRRTCCNIFCMPNLCHCIQRSNYACYCYNMDCIYCCNHVACRVCCHNNNCSKCIVQCCRHLPICLLLDCLKHTKCCDATCLPLCNFICGCIHNCKIRDCQCVCQICRAICQIVGCLFK